MSGPSCTDVCEIIIDWLRSLGFKISQEEDHTDVINALEECHLVKDKPCPEQSIIAIDVLQFMRDNLEWAVPSGSKDAVKLAKEFKEHLEEGLSAWIEDEFNIFKKNRSK
jgi:hypothetical protein